jgi:cell division septum initiation protein DivIVA
MSHAGRPTEPYSSSSGVVTASGGSGITASAGLGGQGSLSAITPAPPGMPPLPTRRNGYEQGAVHEFVGGLLQRLREAEGRVREAVTGAAEGTEKAVDTPASRANVEAQIADLLRAAADEAEGNRLGAANQAADLVGKAEEEARTIVAAAKEQAGIVMTTARDQAKTQLDDASVKAAAVDEGARKRLDAIVALHAETSTRLAQIRDVTGQLLAAEEARGPLADEVTRALPPHLQPGNDSAPGPESGGTDQAASPSASLPGSGPAPQRPYSGLE